MRTCGIILLLLVQSYAVLAQHKWSPFAKLPDLGWYTEGGVNTMHIAEKQAWLGGVEGAVTWSENNALGLAFSWSLNRIEPAN